MPKLPSISKDTLSDKAYHIIKEAIVSNQYKPGDLLVEESLAEQLSISRTPIRDALKRLQFEHIIKPNSNGKLVVSSVSLEDIQNVTVVRCNLESLAISLVDGKMDAEKKKKLKKLADKCAAIMKNGIEGKALEYLEADYEFHMYIAECSENSFLYDMIDRVNFVTKRFHILSGTLDLYIQTALEEHQAVVDAIMEDRYQDAAVAMVRHLNQVGLRMPIK